MAAGRQDSAGYNGRLEKEVQDGDGDGAAGASVALLGRGTGAENGRQEGGIYHPTRKMIPCLNNPSFAYQKVIYVDKIARSYV